MTASQPAANAQPTGWATAAIVTALLALAYFLRYPLLPFAFAAALAYVVRPIIRALRRWMHLPRLAAVLLVYVSILVLIGLALWGLVGTFGERVVHAAGQAPALLNDLFQRLIGPQVHLFGQTFTSSDLTRQTLDALKGWVIQPYAVLAAGSLVVVGPATLILILVVLFYLINSGRRIAEGVLWLAPPRYRPHLRDLYRRVDPMLRQYVRGVLLVVLYTSIAAWVVLGPIFHLPFAPLLAVVVGALELVPVVGPAASMALIGLSSLLNGGGLWSFAGFMVFAVALRVSIDELVGPLVLGRAVTLHPVVIIMAFLIGSTMFGILGVLVAVPAAAAVKIVLGAWYETEESR